MYSACNAVLMLSSAAGDGPHNHNRQSSIPTATVKDAKLSEDREQSEERRKFGFIRQRVETQ